MRRMLPADAVARHTQYQSRRVDEVRVIENRPLLRYTPDELVTWLTGKAPVIDRKTEEKGSGTVNGATDGNGLFDAQANPWEALGDQFSAPINVEARLAAMRYRGSGDSGIHITQLEVAASLLNQGHPIDEVTTRLFDATCQAAGAAGASWNWTKERNDIGKLCESWVAKHPEIQDRIEHGAEQSSEPTDEGSSKPNKTTLCCSWELDPAQARIRYLIKKLIPETGVGLISGQWGTFKTFVVLSLAGSIMTEQPFCGFRVKRRGGVLLLAGEGEGEIHVRFEALRQTIAPLSQLPFVWTAEFPPFSTKNAIKELAAIAADAAEKIKAEFNLPLSLIVVDTVAAAAGYTKAGDDNDAATTQNIVNVMKRLSKASGAFVVGVDHFGKDIETGTRGSSAKEGGVDVILALLGDRAVTGKVENTRMGTRKVRGAESGQEFGFTVRSVQIGVDEDGEPETSLVVEWGEGEIKAKARETWPKSLTLLQRAITNALASSGTEQRPFPDGPSVRAVNVETVRAEFYRTYVADGTPEQKQNTRRQAFNRAIKDAQNRNLIGAHSDQWQNLVWLTTAPQ